MKEEIYKKVKEKLKGHFGIKPVKDVGKIFSLIQAFDLPEKEINSIAQNIYIKLFQDLKRGDQNQARQSWVVASGNDFENLIRVLINEELNSKGILAIKGDQLKNKPIAKNIVEFLTLKASRRCTQKNTGVWPDSDIVVLTKEKGGRFKAFALLNCKTSDHSRNDAVLFWALALRDNNIKYCLVTRDLDKKFVRGDNDPRISSLRRKCEAYLDRTFTTHPLTSECSQVVKLDLKKDNGIKPLTEDLLIWRESVAPDFIDDPIDLSVLG